MRRWAALPRISRDQRATWLLRALSGAIVAGVVVLAGCGADSPSVPASRTAGDRVPVVAAENFYGEVAAAVCGARCQVTSILANPDADPHAYQATVPDAEAVARARLVIENGAGYDAFMAHLLNASPAGGRRVVDVATLTGHATGANPHFWYDPATMPLVAKAVARDLAALDPAHAQAYRAAAARWIASLQPLQAEIATIRSRYPRAPVAYTEPVFGYMGQALGLRVRTPESFQKAIEDGRDPSVADMATELTLLQKHQVRALIYNRQTVTPVTTRMETAARVAGVPVVGISELEPAGQSYVQWMLGELRALERALGGKG